MKKWCRFCLKQTEHNEHGCLEGTNSAPMPTTPVPTGYQGPAPKAEAGCKHGHIGACTACCEEEHLAALQARADKAEAEAKELRARVAELEQYLPPDSEKRRALVEQLENLHQREIAQARADERENLMSEIEMLRGRIADLEQERDAAIDCGDSGGSEPCGKCQACLRVITESTLAQARAQQREEDAKAAQAAKDPWQALADGEIRSLGSGSDCARVQRELCAAAIRSGNKGG